MTTKAAQHLTASIRSPPRSLVLGGAQTTALLPRPCCLCRCHSSLRSDHPRSSSGRPPFPTPSLSCSHVSTIPPPPPPLAYAQDTGNSLQPGARHPPPCRCPALFLDTRALVPGSSWPHHLPPVPPTLRPPAASTPWMARALPSLSASEQAGPHLEGHPLVGQASPNPSQGAIQTSPPLVVLGGTLASDTEPGGLEDGLVSLTWAQAHPFLGRGTASGDSLGPCLSGPLSVRAHETGVWLLLPWLLAFGNACSASSSLAPPLRHPGTRFGQALPSDASQDTPKGRPLSIQSRPIDCCSQPLHLPSGLLSPSPWHPAPPSSPHTPLGLSKPRPYPT